MNASFSLAPSDCHFFGKTGLWANLPAINDEWLRKQISRFPQVRRGPYVLALDHEDQAIHLIDAISFRKQVRDGADMESLGVVLIGSAEEAAFFTPKLTDAPK